MFIFSNIKKRSRVFWGVLFLVLAISNCLAVEDVYKNEVTYFLNQIGFNFSEIGYTDEVSLLPKIEENEEEEIKYYLPGEKINFTNFSAGVVKIVIAGEKDKDKFKKLLGDVLIYQNDEIVKKIEIKGQGEFVLNLEEGDYIIVFNSATRDLFRVDIFSVALKAMGDNLLVWKNDQLVKEEFVKKYFQEFDNLYVVDNQFLLDYFGVVSSELWIREKNLEIKKEENNEENFLYKDFTGNLCQSCQEGEIMKGNISSLNSNLTEFSFFERGNSHWFLENDLKKIANYSIVKELVFEQNGDLKNVFFISPSILALEKTQIKNILGSVFEYKDSLIDYFINFSQEEIIPRVPFLFILVLMVIFFGLFLGKYIYSYLKTGSILGTNKINIWKFLKRQEEKGVISWFLKWVIRFTIGIGGFFVLLGGSLVSYIFYLVDIGQSPEWIENIRSYFHNLGIECPKCLLFDFLGKVIPWILWLVLLVGVFLYFYRFRYVVKSLKILLNKLDKKTQYQINKFSFYGFVIFLILSCLSIIFPVLTGKKLLLGGLTFLFGLFFKFFEQAEGHIPRRNEILFITKYFLWALVPAYLIFIVYTNFYPWGGIFNYRLSDNQNVELIDVPAYKTEGMSVFKDDFSFTLEPDFYSQKNKVNISFILKSKGNLYLKFKNEDDEIKRKELFPFNKKEYNYQADFGDFLLNSIFKVKNNNLCQYSKASFSIQTPKNCISLRDFFKNNVLNNKNIYLSPAFIGDNNEKWDGEQKFIIDDYLKQDLGLEDWSLAREEEQGNQVDQEIKKKELDLVMREGNIYFLTKELSKVKFKLKNLNKLKEEKTLELALINSQNEVVKYFYLDESELGFFGQGEKEVVIDLAEEGLDKQSGLFFWQIKSSSDDLIMVDVLNTEKVVWTGEFALLEDKEIFTYNYYQQLKPVRIIDNQELLITPKTKLEWLKTEKLEFAQEYNLDLSVGEVINSANIFAKHKEQFFYPYRFQITDFVEQADLVLQLKTVKKEELLENWFQKITVNLDNFLLEKFQQIKFEVVNLWGDLVILKEIEVQIEK